MEFSLENQPVLHDLVKTAHDHSIWLEVGMSKSPQVYYCLVLRGGEKVQRGMGVVNSNHQLQVPVGTDVLGRAFDIFGDVHDLGKPLTGVPRRPLFAIEDKKSRLVPPSKTIMETGIKAIDFFAPLTMGGKTALIGGAGIGKTVILTELVNRMVIQKQQKNALAVFCAVGERSREAQELYQSFKKANVLPFTSLILGQMGENPAVRMKTGYAGAALAEYFRDEHHSNVLFFMDNIYRFAQAGHELSMLMNMIPSEDGYQSTLPSEMGTLQEKLSSTDSGTITSFMALYVPSDDMTDSAVRSAFPYMDTMIILSREVYQTGRFPAMDLLASTSSALTPLLVGNDHYDTYREAKSVLEESAALERIVSLVGESELSPDNRRTYKRSQLIISYMTQDLFVSEEETGHAAAFVTLKETVQIVKDILSGKYDELDPEDLRFLGSIRNLEERLAKKHRRHEPQQPTWQEKVSAAAA